MPVICDLPEEMNIQAPENHVEMEDTTKIHDKMEDTMKIHDKMEDTTKIHDRMEDTTATSQFAPQWQRSNWYPPLHI